MVALFAASVVVLQRGLAATSSARRMLVAPYTAHVGGSLRGIMDSGGREGGKQGLGRGGGGARMMGGGPRTYPGGVSKWEWKKSQEKQEKQIERARLSRERQAFEEHRRQELSAADRPWEQRSVAVEFPQNGGRVGEETRSIRSEVRAGNAKPVSPGIRGGLGNLSIRKNFSSTPSLSGAYVAENVRDERTGGREGPPHRRSGSGKRPAKVPEMTLDSRSAPDSEKRLKRDRQKSPELDEGEGAGPSHLSETRFDEFEISPLSLRALHEVLGYQRMTAVQAATFRLILKGQDVLAKAKTGTGKTIAFLLPAIEAILESRRGRRAAAVSGRSPINVLIICPTRELASQAATEAKTLMTYHKDMDAQIVIGGTNMNTEAKNLEKRHCQVLVATPGRLLDHMSLPEFRQQFLELKVLVLDEADRLLDMGFRKDLEKIIKMLPVSRQTLLFSATVPVEVHKVSALALKKGHAFVDTVGEDADDTHAKVQQYYVISPLEDQMAVLYQILVEHMNEEEDYKVMVFCTTARYTALMAEFSTKLGINTLEIHSRKSQTYRTKVSDTFRNAEGGVVLFTSDVSARGVDYPDVTLVIQMGIPAGREEYIHRLGRTGRAGKEGQGILLLTPWEQGFLRALKDIPISEYRKLKVTPENEDKVAATLDIVKLDTKEKAYQAWLGYYNTAKLLNLTKVELVRLANDFSYALGMDEPPILLKRTIGMMNLRGVPGLRTQ